METYVILRRGGWRTADDLAAAAERSTSEGERMPDDIAWIRSYVIAEPGGTLGTVCIYQATDADAVRDHAGRVGMPADEVLECVDTVVVRPDPQPDSAAA
jgi:hypothetical protein